jgi:hypothetical protein
MKKISLVILAVVVVLTSIGVACAYDYPDQFQIKNLYVSGATNYHFRIWSMTPNAPLCTGGPTNPSWAYINEADSGAKGKIASLTIAYVMGKKVALTTITVGSYCQIVEFQIMED